MTELPLLLLNNHPSPPGFWRFVITAVLVRHGVESGGGEHSGSRFTALRRWMTPVVPTASFAQLHLVDAPPSFHRTAGFCSGYRSLAKAQDGTAEDLGDVIASRWVAEFGFQGALQVQAHPIRQASAGSFHCRLVNSVWFLDVLLRPFWDAMATAASSTPIGWWILNVNVWVIAVEWRPQLDKGLMRVMTGVS